MYIGARRDLVATLQERAERAEREQEMRIEQAQAMERNRIAREMHDVLAHRLSLVAMHAGALEYCRGLTDAEVAEAADVIRPNAHQRAGGPARDPRGAARPPTPTQPRNRPSRRWWTCPALVEESGLRARGCGSTTGSSDLAQAPARSAAARTGWSRRA